MADNFPCKRLNLLANLDLHDFGASIVNDIWGWTSPRTGQEIALVGFNSGVAFVDVSTPTAPVLLGRLPSQDSSSTNWRDMKVYEGHMFVVSDGNSRNGLQVFDLAQLETIASTPVVFEATAHYAGVTYTHNIAINERTGFAYLTGSNTCGGGLHMVNIRDPINPVFAGCFQDTRTGRRGTGYSHDVQCVNYSGPDTEHRDKEICFGSNETAISISDVTDKSSPSAISFARYPSVSYSHQGWLTEDQRYFYANDELDELDHDFGGTRTLIWDVADLDDPVFLTPFINPAGSSDHNLYVSGNYLYQANYKTGLRILDISEAENPSEIAYFDTHPESDNTRFDGAWSVYPYFESGTLIVSTIDRGLFVLELVSDEDLSTALVLMISPESVGEDAGTVNIEVTASLDGAARTTATSVTISVTDGTADSDDDYRLVSDLGPLVIPAEDLSVTGIVEIEILEDDFTEENETIVIGASATDLTGASEEVAITDDDASLSVTLRASPPRVVENVGTAEVTVTATVDDGRTFAGVQTVTVSVGVPGDSAKEGTDYAAVSDFAITIPAGVFSATGNFTLNPNDDDLAEGSETVSVEGALSERTVTSAQVTITDDDAQSTALVLAISPESLREDAGTVGIEVTASLDGAARTTATSVTISVTDGTADSDDDYRLVSDLSPLVIPAEDLSVMGIVRIEVLEDDLSEENETIVIGAFATDLTGASEMLTITDDDASLSVTLSVSPSTVAEDVGAAEVTVTATVDGGRTFTGAQTVTVSVGAPGDSAEEGTAYAAVSDFTITIPGGSSSATGSFTLNLNGDDLAEGSETVSVEGALDDRTVTSAALTITDDDAQSTALVLTISPESLDEAAGTKDIKVTASLDAGAATENTPVTVNITDGTARSADYRVVSIPGLLVIPARDLSITGTVQIEIIDDDLAEGNETIVIEASATGLTRASEMLTITDEDASLSVTLSVSPPRVVEDAGTAEVTVTAMVDEGRTFAGVMAVTVSVGAPGDSAEEGTDYGVVEGFAITIPGGSSSATGRFTLDLTNDDLAEGSETVGVVGLLSGRIVTPAQVTITDDDVPSTALLLTISPQNLGEDAGTKDIEVTASLNGAVRSEATPVTINITGGTASSADYAPVVVPESLVISAGGRSATGTVRIEVLEDDLAEDNETVVIGASATGLTGASEILTITDDDASLSVTLRVSPSTVAEDVGAAPVVIVTATVDGGRTFAGVMAVTISVGAPGDSAEEGTDYEPVSDFAIIIPAGDPSATGTFTLNLNGDDLAEGSEMISVEGALSGRTVTPAQVTITDNDAESVALALTIAPVRLHENSGTSWVRFGASLDGAARLMNTPVDVSVTGVTATVDVDYSAPVPTSVMIPAGETSISDSLQITITDDDEVEGNETVLIGVSATGFAGTTQNLVIIDDESGVRVDTLMAEVNATGGYTITTPVRQNMGVPVTSVVLHYGDGMTFEMTPMEMSPEGLYTAELMAPAEGGTLYYYVLATNEDGLTATYPPEGRYQDISDYTGGSRLVLLDFENGDAGDKSAVGHAVVYRGGEPTFAEDALVLDGMDDHAEILGSSLGASEEFALEIMFNADDFDAAALDAGGTYLVAKPARCTACWEESTFSLLWERSADSGTLLAARFWNPEYGESGQVELEIPMPLVARQWYHAVLEVQRRDAGQRAVLRLRDQSGMFHGEDMAVLPALPAISTYPIFVGHIGDRGFFEGRIDDVGFYNYAHFGLSLASSEDAWEVPEGYVLEQNYPNPFNPVTTIRYDLAKVGHVRLEVSDLLGRRVALLVDAVQEAGAQEVRFDARDLPSGMYLYRLRVEDFVSVKKMVLLK